MKKCINCKRSVSVTESELSLWLFGVRDLDALGGDWCCFCAVQAYRNDVELSDHENQVGHA